MIVSIIKTNDGFYVCERGDNSVFYLCSHQDCAVIAHGAGNIEDMLVHRATHLKKRFKAKDGITSKVKTKR